MQHGDWRWTGRWGAPRLPWGAPPAGTRFGSPLSQHPLWCCSSMCPLAPVGVWPFSGLCLPPPRGERAEGNTFLIVSLPFMGCQGAEAAAPRPFPLRSLCLFSFPPRPPLRTPTPPAPLMLCRWEQGGHLGPSPFLPWISCSPEALREGSSHQALAFLPPCLTPTEWLQG